MPRVGLPSNSPRQTMPVSGMELASDPASGPVSAKHGTSSPRASRGLFLAFCSSVLFLCCCLVGLCVLGFFFVFVVVLLCVVCFFFFAVCVCVVFCCLF